MTFSPPVAPTHAALAFLLTASWLLILAFQVRVVRQYRRLDEVLGLRERGADRSAAGVPGGAGATGPLPPLSVVVTARDERESIERTVRSLLGQRYPGLEIVVVDDRSTDGTGAILDRLAAEATAGAAGPGLTGNRPRLVVVHNTSLPAGWLGKCHACHVGAARTRGDWILFTDGDVELLREDLLFRVVTLAGRLGLDHVAVTPDTRPMSPFQAAVMGVFGLLFCAGARAHEIDRDRPRGGAGVGAFNLVRRTAYERVGGHTLLRMDPGDDFKLGRLLKESGARQRLWDGVGLIRCPWHRGVARIVRGLEKNFFAGLDYSAFLLVTLTLGLLFVTLAPPFLPFAGTAQVAGTPGWFRVLIWTPPALQAAALMIAAGVQTGRQGGNPVLLALLYPAALLVLLYAAWNSACATLRRGGIVWRGTFYPLADLRRGLVRRGAARGGVDAGASGLL
ncbi:MAG: glycosyltransferase [Candidatus Polarisedimenticolia bacterium]